MPAIQIRFWKEDAAGKAGTGKTIIYNYNKDEASFEKAWEVLYDW
jgi:hypothetical protein